MTRRDERKKILKIIRELEYSRREMGYSFSKHGYVLKHKSKVKEVIQKAIESSNLSKDETLSIILFSSLSNNYDYIAIEELIALGVNLNNRDKNGKIALEKMPQRKWEVYRLLYPNTDFKKLQDKFFPIRHLMYPESFVKDDYDIVKIHLENLIKQGVPISGKVIKGRKGKKISLVQFFMNDLSTFIGLHSKLTLIEILLETGGYEATDEDIKIMNKTGSRVSTEINDRVTKITKNFLLGL